jgi:hypothetical protein
MDIRKFSKSTAALPPSVRENPPPLPTIPFVSKVKKMEEVDGPDADKSEWIKLEFLMDPDNPASGSKYSQQCYLQGWIPRGLYQVGDGLA